MDKFIPGTTYITPSGKVDGNIEEVLIRGWIKTYISSTVSGEMVEEFETRIAQETKMRHAIYCNSGSSANLLAISALCSKQTQHGLKPGDTVITTAAGFPTTLAPIYQNKLVPIFVDIDIITCNIDTFYLENALQYNPKAIFVAHTLGNPFDIDTVSEFANRNRIWMISDCCDAFGSLYRGKPVETYGAMSTHSYYPAHQLCTIEGGTVLTKSPKFDKILRSLRDWGRDCNCLPGHSNRCGKRFGHQLGKLPYGYDHKYTYSEIGYNLKGSDLHAAYGLGQLNRLPYFQRKRRKNWREIHERMEKYEEFFILPQATYRSDPNWFGFLLTIRNNSPFARQELVTFLEENKIGTRLLFGGNLTKQPAFMQEPYALASDLTMSNVAMKNSFWIGCWPGITIEMIDYIEEIFSDFMRDYL